MILRMWITSSIYTAVLLLSFLFFLFLALLLCTFSDDPFSDLLYFQLAAGTAGQLHTIRPGATHKTKW
jgi:hypothetical protein